MVKQFTPACAAGRQLRQAAGKNVPRVFHVDHEHQDFLRAVRIGVAQAVLTEISQIGADGGTEQIHRAVIHLADFVRGMSVSRLNNTHNRSSIIANMSAARSDSRTELDSPM